MDGLMKGGRLGESLKRERREITCMWANERIERLVGPMKGEGREIGWTNEGGKRRVGGEMKGEIGWANERKEGGRWGGPMKIKRG